MSMAVFDTNIMIDYLNGSKKAADIVNKNQGSGPIGIASITGYELAKGIGDADKELLVTLFERVRVYNMDLSAAWVAGELYKKLRASGLKLSEADLLIVATALSNGETFVTQDRDFKRLGTEKIIVVE